MACTPAHPEHGRSPTSDRSLSALPYRSCWWKSWWSSCLLLLLLPILPATISWRNHAQQIAAARQLAPGEVDLAQALAWDHQQILMWVDARTEAEYSQQHIPGAVLLNEDHWDDLFPDLIAWWAPELEMVVYCDSSLCDASHHVAERLKKDLQTARVHVLHGGWQAWLSAQQADPRPADEQP